MSINIVAKVGGESGKKLAFIIKGGLDLKPQKLNTYLSCHNFFSLSSVQILLIPACCLLCVF